MRPKLHFIGKNRAGLTKPEMRVLALVGDGLEVKEIASRLGKGVSTTQFHIENICYMLDQSPKQLIRTAIGFGMSKL